MTTVRTHRPASQPATHHQMTLKEWTRAISKEFSVAGPWAPTAEGARKVARKDLPERLKKVYDDAKAEGEGDVTVHVKVLDGRAAYMFQWPHWDQGVNVTIRDEMNRVIEPYRDRKKEAEMDTRYALQAAREDHFKNQRPKSADKSVDHWLRMYQATAGEEGTSEYIDAPDTWKVTPNKLEKVVGSAAVKEFNKLHADAAYRNPDNGTVMLEKYEHKDGDAIRHYVVLNHLGKALKKIALKSEV